MPTINIRLPWRRMVAISKVFLDAKPFSVLGCLSSEERCCALPLALFSKPKQEDNKVFLLQVIDPPDRCPDYRQENRKKTALNETVLRTKGIRFEKLETDLLADENSLINTLQAFNKNYNVETVILDISTLPKRYYSLFLRRLLRSHLTKNIIVCYSQPGVNGYPVSHRLAEDIMSCSYLPGFTAKSNEEDCKIVISLGFENFNIESILEKFRANLPAKFLLNFPPNGEYFRRQWKVLREVIGVREVMKDIEVIPALDVEQVYLTLDKINKDSNGLILAPFGPKTHSLGMVLFAIKHDCGLIYSQPQTYNPYYSSGIGESWGYVVKWDGILCYDRVVGKI